MHELDVQCPYCFEQVSLELEPDLEGALVIDCEVCCRPWQVHVSRNEDGEPSATVERAQ